MNKFVVTRLISSENTTQGRIMPTNIISDVLSTILGRPALCDGDTKILVDLKLYYLARLLQLRIAGLDAETDRESCRGMLREMSEQATARFLRSPALCEALRLGAKEEVLVDLISAEFALDTEGDWEGWSPLGDCWLGRSRHSLFPWLVESGNKFWSPRLTGGIPIDLSLTLHLKFPSAGLQQPFFLNESEVSASVKNINCALDALNEVFPLGNTMFTSLVSNIVLRGDKVRLRECWGASSGIALGRVVLINAHNQADIRILSEILLHEATHCAVDCAELVNPLWRTEVRSSENRGAGIASPWTSNALTPHAFLHACIVWAVLLHYWIACEMYYGADHVSRGRIHLIEQGFIHMDNEVDLTELLEPLAPTALEVITAIKRSAHRVLAENGPRTDQRARTGSPRVPKP